jgi:peptidyl-prolyl cis-trans isomerase C
MHACRLRFFKPLAIASALFLLPALAYAQAPVAKVNGVTIPQAKLDAIMKARAAGKQPDTPEIRAAIRDTLINQEVVAQ